LTWPPARRQVTQADAEWLSQQKQAYPTLALTAGYTLQIQRKAIGFPNAHSYDLALETQLPTCDRNQGNIAKARAAAAAARDRLAAREAQVRAEVERALADYRTAYEIVVRANPDYLAMARRVRDRIDAQYEAGECTLLELIEAQKDFRDTARIGISSRAAYWRSLYRLRTAAGLPPAAAGDEPPAP
jgi:cobalt-zinc-cadmium efflux system outer membrane protein